jgi:hypothetical protein
MFVQNICTKNVDVIDGRSLSKRVNGNVVQIINIFSLFILLLKTCFLKISLLSLFSFLYPDCIAVPSHQPGCDILPPHSSSTTSFETFFSKKQTKTWGELEVINHSS